MVAGGPRRQKQQHDFNRASFLCWRWVTTAQSRVSLRFFVSQHPEVDEIIECFEADLARKPFLVDEHSLLIWCNANGRDRIAQFIDAAKTFSLCRTSVIRTP
jgi:hypothetical protein